MRIDSLHIHPLKGARAVDLERARIEPRGLEGDRRWLATTPDGAFLTQRDCPALARIAASPVEGGLHLSTDDGEKCEAMIDLRAERRRVTIWRDEVEALHMDAKTDAWLSDKIGRPARLFYMDDAARRMTSARWGAPGPVSFADGYPVLVANAASLAALNEAIAEDGGGQVVMARFRPNIVLSGADPWAEDCWRVLRLGEAVIELVKPCDRCVVTTKDQKTGESLGKEPLKTLARLRRSADPRVSGVLFGWNAVMRRAGGVAVGDEVEIMEARKEGWALASS